MKKYIPNSITCLNLISGIVGVICAYQGFYLYTLVCVLLSSLFDFLDGFMARLLRSYSPMGKELDSLADMISFGLVPGMLAYSMLSEVYIMDTIVPFIGFALTVCSALRLAKFNIDERQSSSFIGLATPANALFWTGLSCSTFYYDFSVVWLLLLILLFSYLLVSPLPMFSLKFKSLKWSENWGVFIFLIVAVLLLLFFVIYYYSIIYFVLSVIIMWYILWSMILYILDCHH